MKAPITKRDGLANFVQMIINAAESGDVREALLRAVDLHQDIESGIYDAAITDREMRTQARLLSETTEKHQQELVASFDRGIAAGAHAEKARIAALLGL